MPSFLKSKTTWVVGIIVLLILASGSYYNRFTSLGIAADGQWAQVETQLQRRFDLVPNLTASVKGIFAQEQEVFGAIAEARTRYAGAISVEEKVGAANSYESALGRLLVVMEAYPALQSNTNVTRLMDELAGTENRVAVERSRFNSAVQAYNTSIARIPGMLFAKLFGFGPRSLFKAAEGAETAPKVEL